MIPEPTWHPTNRDYHALRRWSPSRLGTFRRSPQTSWRWWSQGVEPPSDESDSLRLGRALNLLLLEHGEAGIYTCSRGRGTDAFRSAEQAYPDRLVLTTRERNAAEHMAQAVLHPQCLAAETARALLTAPGYSEYAFQWTDDTGVPCKCMLDRLGIVSGCVAYTELKSAVEVELSRFKRHAKRFGYPEQVAFNVRGLSHVVHEPVQAWMVVVQNKPPWEVECYLIGERFIAVGEHRVQRDLHRLANCLEDTTGATWRRPSELCAGGFTVLDLP